MKVHVIDQPLNESIVRSNYLLPPVNHQSSIFPFKIKMTDCDLPIKIQIQTTSSWQGSSVIECLPKD